MIISQNNDCHAKLTRAWLSKSALAMYSVSYFCDVYMFYLKMIENSCSNIVF